MNHLFAVKELFPYSFGFLVHLKPKKIPKEALDQGIFYSNRFVSHRWFCRRINDWSVSLFSDLKTCENMYIR